MDTVIFLATIILPLLIGYILGKNRDNNKIIFNKKLKIYSDIIYHLSSAKYLQLNLDISEEKLKTLIKEIDSYKENESTNQKFHFYKNNKLEEIEKERSLVNYRNKLIKLFAPARLIGSKALVDELREYFSLVSEYYSVKKKKNIEDLSKKISKSVMEIEQLMRKDLGNFRILSSLEIWNHLYNK